MDLLERGGGRKNKNKNQINFVRFVSHFCGPLLSWNKIAVQTSRVDTAPKNIGGKKTNFSGVNHLA